MNTLPTQIKVINLNRSIIVSNAHKLKKEFNLSFGEAQKQAWQQAKAIALITCLSLGYVEFTYIKGDGTIREAKGTTNKDLFVCPMEIFNTNDVTIGKNIVYFDTEAQSKRQCKIGRLVKIKRVLIYKEQTTYEKFTPKYFQKVA